MGDSTSSRRFQIRRKRTPMPPFDINNLRDDLVQEILIRLPSSKEATRCKLVCKRWLSLISSDCFVTASTIHHRDNDDKNLLPFTLLVMRDRTNLECVEFLIHSNRLSRRTTMDLGFLYAGRQPNYRFELVASCGDLILLSSGKNYCICNILTRQWIAIPPAPSGRGNFGESIGFMYEPLDDRHNKYLVFRFLPCDWYTDDGDSKFDVEIFSSEEGRWTRSVVRSPQILNCLCSNNPIIACGRMLYTLNYCHGYIYNSVVAFDPFANDPARLIRLIDVPDEARDIPFMDSKLGVCGGRLQFAILIFQHCRQPRIRVWELEDDYRMGKWRMVHNVRHASTNRIFRRAYRISILAFHPYNKDLICFLVSNDLLVVYNMRTNDVEYSAHSSLFALQDSPRPLGVFPITQQYWWPTPV